MTTSVLEHSLVSPPPSAAAELSLPLTFFDLLWLHFSPIQRLVFYEFPISKNQFMETIIPELKLSLSQTLQHFLSLAGNIVIPSDSTIPRIQYVDGKNSVPLVISECISPDIDFKSLIGNHARNCEDFHPFVPSLPPSSNTSDSTLVPLLALQVTLFPDIGICIGITNHHSIGDASSIFSFMKTWASSLRKLLNGTAQNSSNCNSLPLYNRSLIKYPDGLDAIFWNQIETFNVEETGHLPSITKKLRRTFVIRKDNVNKLKSLVKEKRPNLPHLSTFVVVCGLVWNCLLKSKVACGGEVNNEEELEYFLFAADCRSRLDPPVSPNYFGNCLVPVLASGLVKKLIGEEGFVEAAELIGEAIHRKFLHKDRILEGAERWIPELVPLVMDIGHITSVAGSPKFNYYELDFGWGKPKLFEFVSIEMTGAISLSWSAESGEDMEIGLALSAASMNAFAEIFTASIQIDI